ncbi:hypothetical protein HY251_01690 [bacterium]|nr:hypothetical protein [bacterium]
MVDAVTPWLKSATWDLSWFVFPGIAAAALVLALRLAGVIEGPQDDLPPWAWLATVVAIDVAHVYATLYRVYLDRPELLRRRELYVWAPLLAWLTGIVLYAISDRVFWSALAYLAVFHFVKQQEGFVRLYRAKAGERERGDLLWDRAAVYAMTLYPLLLWHAHLPRAFHWFRNRDFVTPPALDPAALDAALAFASALYWGFLAVYALRVLLRFLSGRSPWNPGKWGVLLATWACWYVGIVPWNSDLAFTVTNVVLHGVPYLGLILLVGSRKQASGGELSYEPGSLPASVFSRGARGLVLGLLVLLAIAYLEEGVWDKLVWHEHGTVFGEALRVGLGPFLAIVVPLLSVPQATHYFLDGMIWKLDGSNPGLDLWLGISRRQ